MATDKAPTKAEFLEALNKKGINNLEELVDALMPETGGYSILFSPEPMPLIVIPNKGSFAVKWYLIDDDEG